MESEKSKIIMLFVLSSLSLSYPSHSRTRRRIIQPVWSLEEKILTRPLVGLDTPRKPISTTNTPLPWGHQIKFKELLSKLDRERKPYPFEENYQWKPFPIDPIASTGRWRIGWSEEEKNCPSGELYPGWCKIHDCGRLPPVPELRMLILSYPEAQAMGSNSNRGLIGGMVHAFSW
ncbi:hypothetical protein TVAG_244420 [Trichomonas vaginalis G3]|uniref:Uncharacterized protein n=1 Tax=Trichomonas vaginalis (strain ATCC PRA-98 / G3) TaxID=412133 RepID=A2ES29_TRIV3|nr:hypothetical protein TVAGG3_0689860 [Trichomonas vaginalis G3]EAY04541.1 hypothetical protein TVAG_244420 [Trichomonas vaginalis G3]KAI5508489.1 hypothetical protein TVAGG3_0689860 [Trichomonas vaginalis G3]|eukprot:XP_001316764.1 hypothetical protein [Trichomonas vaginalis G3]